MNSSLLMMSPLTYPEFVVPGEGVVGEINPLLVPSLLGNTEVKHNHSQGGYKIDGEDS